MSKISREDFLASVQPDDLAGHLREVADHCGVETAVRLWGPFQGATLSIPKGALRRAAIRYIRKHYDGTNLMDIVRATGFAERFVYDVVARSPVKNNQHRLV